MAEIGIGATFVPAGPFPAGRETIRAASLAALEALDPAVLYIGMIGIAEDVPGTLYILTDLSPLTWAAQSSGGGTVTGVTGTAPIVSSGGAAPAISISAATTSAAGSMSGADKTKLDAFNVFRRVANRAARDAILTWADGDRCQITGENQFNLAGNIYEYSSTGWQLLGVIWNDAIYGGWDADGAQLFYYAALTEEWAQSTAYSIDDVRRAPAAIGEHVYTCTTAGTSAGAGTGPSGTGTGIADGTAVWSFVGRALLAIPQLIHGGAFVRHEIEGPGDGLPAGIVYDATAAKKQGFIAYLIGGASGFSDGISFGVTHFLHVDP